MIKMKVALLHDFFEKPGLSGGGEALALTVAKAFKADVYTAYVHPEFKIPEGLNVQQIEIPDKVFEKIALRFGKSKKDIDKEFSRRVQLLHLLINKKMTTIK